MEKLLTNSLPFILENSNDAVFLINPLDGKFLYANKKAQQDLGYSEKEMLNLSVEDVAASLEFGKTWATHAKMLKKKRQVTFESKNKRKDGTIYPVKVTTKLINQNGSSCMLGITQDISLEKFQEFTLNKYRTLINSMDIGMLQVDPQNNILFANDAFCKHTGYNFLELLGKNASSVLLHEKSEHNKVLAVMKERERGKSTDYELKTKTKSGKEKWWLISGSPVFDFDGNNIGSIGMHIDITEKKQAELLKTVSYNIAEKSNTEIFDLQKICADIQAELSKVMEARNFYIAIWDKETHGMAFPYYRDQHQPRKKPLRARQRKKGLSEYTINKREPVLLSKKQIIRLFKKEGIEQYGKVPEQWMGVPLKTKGKTIGLLAIQSYKNPRAYTKYHLDFLNFVSNQIANIMRRLMVQDELIQREDRMRTLTENAPDFIININRKGTIEYINRVFKGDTREEIIGKSVYDCVQKKMVPFARKKIGIAFKTRKTQELEIKGVGPKNTRRWYSIKIGPITSKKKVESATLIARDITERKNTQRFIERFQEIVNNMDYGLHVYKLEKENDDRTLRMVMANPTAKTLTKVPNRSLVGHLIDECFPDLRERKIPQRFAEVVRTGIPQAFDNFYYGRDKVAYACWHFKVFPLPGNHVGVIFDDVTKHKKLEESLNSANRELETFFYKASHDLKGPLSSSRGLLNLAIKEVNEPESLKYFDMIYNSIDKLDNILDSLTHVALIKQSNINFERVNFRKIINDILTSLKYAEEYRGVEIKLSYNTRKHFYSNSKLLRTILQNLIENALKYKNGRKRKAYVAIVIVVKNGLAKITVKDNGIGIEKRFQHRIFEMFYRANEKATGSGLGLYIVKNAVEKLNGSIEFKSTRGKGTNFSISLPSQGKE